VVETQLLTHADPVSLVRHLAELVEDVKERNVIAFYNALFLFSF
jgi:hypothetical protein